MASVGNYVRVHPMALSKERSNACKINPIDGTTTEGSATLYEYLGVISCGRSVRAGEILEIAQSA